MFTWILFIYLFILQKNQELEEGGEK